MMSSSEDNSLPPVLVQRFPDSAAVQQLRLQGVDPVLAALFSSRGVTDVSEIRGSIRDILAPSSLKGCLDMASELADCLVTQKRVLIISDYDCDGATACATLLAAFYSSGMNVDYLVPDRKEDGYGLSESIVLKAAQLPIRPDVIITVDSGISSTDGVALANSLGIEVLITDHHLAPETLPDAKIIVNPNQAGCTFKSKSIAGCGVAWYVAKAYADELIDRGHDPRYDPDDLLQFVALGTIADVVKLDSNNRALVKEGLRRVRYGSCTEGVKALIAVSNRWRPALTCSDISFGIAPRLNAAGRLGHMSLGIECLMSTKPHRALEMAETLNKINEDRKEIEKRIAAEAKVGMDAFVASMQFKSVENAKSVVVYGQQWHEGVIGIVASKIKEEANRPTFVICDSEAGVAKGSGRSIDGFHLKHALDEIALAHPDILLTYGGHAMAVGVTIAEGKVPAFREALESICAAKLTSDMLQRRVCHDGELNKSYFDPNFIKRLRDEVWGQGFPEPMFIADVSVLGKKYMGEDKQHLRLSVIVGDVEAEAVGFNLGERGKTLPSESTVVYKPEINRYGDVDAVQLMIDHFPTPEMVADYKQKNSLWKNGDAARRAMENFVNFEDRPESKSSRSFRP